MIWHRQCELRFAAELMLVFHRPLAFAGKEQFAHATFKRDRPIVRLGMDEAAQAAICVESLNTSYWKLGIEFTPLQCCFDSGDQISSKTRFQNIA